MKVSVFHHLQINRLYIIVLLMILQYAGNAQGDLSRNYIPPSPQASSLGLFVDANMGNYSGRAEIGIPIYEIKTGAITLPINLNYFTGGIKTTDEGSWVGLNWNLNAGGVIGRIKKDVEDFGWTGFYQINPNSRPCNYDQEPDIFFYNFNGYVGKFMLLYNASAPGYTVRHLTKSNVRISLNSGGGWTITTPDGIQYLFSKEEKTDEYIQSGSTYENSTFTSAWYLTKITATNGETIDFEYNTYHEKVSKTFTQSAGLFPDLFTPDWIIWICHFPYPSPSGGSSTSTLNMDEVLLQKIIFKGGTIVFNTSPRIDLNTVNNYGSQLNSIVIYKGSVNPSNILTSFNLEYDYFTSSSNPPIPSKIHQRLTLKKVQEVSVNNLNKGAYLMEYNSGFVPPKNSDSRYNLGYMTGTGACMLNKIVFPTGGYTELFYSSNQIQDMDNVTLYPGLRIDKIKQYDGVSSNINIKKFQYSGGKLLGRYMPFLEYPWITYGWVDDCPTAGETSWYTIYWTYRVHADLTSLTEMANNNVFGYDNVTVLYGENGENGKAVYEYESNYPTNLPIYPGMVRFYMPVNLSQRNGIQKSVTNYKFNGTTYIPVTKKETVYNSSEVSTVSVGRRVSGSCFGYDITTEWIKKAQEITSTYDESGANPVVETSVYTYNNTHNLLPTSISFTNSKNEVVVSTLKYVHEAAAASGGVYNTMVSKNMIAPLIEKIMTKNSKTVINSTTYKDWGNGIIQPEFEKIQYDNNLPDVKTNYSQYDLQTGTVLERVDRNGIVISYIYDYSGIYPIAEVVNASFNDIALTSFESDGKGNWVFSGSIFDYSDAPTGNKAYVLTGSDITRSGLNTAKSYIVSYWSNGGSYNVNGTSAITGKTRNGWTYYEHKVHNSSIVTVSGIGQIDELRLYPENSFMTSYTYKPLVGITTETDANNKTLYYEYDSFGRLVYLKDQDKNIIKAYEYHYKN